jgi:hypothetical protein
MDTDGLHFMSLSVYEFVLRGKIEGLVEWMYGFYVLEVMVLQIGYCLAAVPARSRHREYNFMLI